MPVAAGEDAVSFPPPPVVALPAGDKPARWAALRDRVLTDPTCCAHVRPGKQVVFGVGNLDAPIMFVGEAPASGRGSERRAVRRSGPASCSQR